MIKALLLVLANKKRIVTVVNMKEMIIFRKKQQNKLKEHALLFTNKIIISLNK